ncbi:MAG: XdhC family protein [Candidatus Binataceae bacterium]
MSRQDQIWTEAVRTLEQGRPFALATIINVRGSTPREVGAKMLIRADGQFGTIGGGCGEAEVFRKAQVVLEDGGTAKLAEIDLTGDFDQDEIGTCGGIMDVLIDPWSPGRDLALARRLSEALGSGRPAALVTLVEPGSAGRAPVGARAVIEPSLHDQPSAIALPADAIARLSERAAAGRPFLINIESDGSFHPATHMDSNGATRVFVDPIVGAQRLIIAGAGHIAQPLAAIGSMLGFHVAVIDDRGAFANRERFPDADQLIVKPFAAAVASLGLDRNCYLVSVTRGHAYDEEVVRAAVGTDCGFIGMIGSRRRVRAMLERLAERGVAAEKLEQVHAPLGVAIGSETPEEIAVAILAEIIRERRTGIRDEFNLGAKVGRLKRRA